MFGLTLYGSVRARRHRYTVTPYTLIVSSTTEYKIIIFIRIYETVRVNNLLYKVYYFIVTCKIINTVLIQI